MFIRIVTCVFLLYAVPSAFAQAAAAPQTSPEDLALDKLVLQVKVQADVDGTVEVATDAGNYVAYIAALTPDAKMGMTPAFHAYEEQRIDKQVEEPGSAGGSGSAVNKGSVPWLFGLALEHGAVTQSVENNSIVFRGNIANVASALKNKDYIQSYLKLHSENALVRNIAAVSFSVSFLTSQPTLSTNTLAGYSFHYDIYNHRDPRDKRWDPLWTAARARMGSAVPNASGALRDILMKDFKTEFANWQQQAEAKIRALPTKASDVDIRAALKSIANDLLGIVQASPKVLAIVAEVAKAIAENEQIKNDVVTKINRSPILSFEYNEVQQSSGATVPATTPAGTVTAPASIPNLSNFNLIFGLYVIAGSQFTLNAGTTLFNSLLAGSNVGRVRDYRVSGQFDIPLPEIANIGKPTLSFSGLYLHLLAEPLGQQVKVNDVAVSRTGGIAFFQSKLTIPAKGSGVKIPISLTIANRTELIKEKDIRGTAGITFDLDSLFSSSK
jgi:hypothetical protein